MNLSGTEIQELCQALEEAYLSYDALKQMVRFKLDEKLESFAGTGELKSVIFNLINWAESQGKLESLIIGAYHENSGNLKLKTFYNNYFPFPEKSSLTSEQNYYSVSKPIIPFSSEQWTEFLWILSSIKYDLLEEICRETLKGITEHIEDNCPEIINIQSLNTLTEILLKKYPDNKDKTPTALEFAERLSKNAKVIETSRTKIKNWLEKVAREKNIELPTYKKTQPSSIAANSYLQIAIEKESEVSDNFILQAELIPNYQEGEKLSDSVPLALTSDGSIVCSLDNIKNNIYEFIKIAKIKLIKEYRYRKYDLTIELFLPIKYLGQHFDLEEIPAGLNQCKPIGYQYQLVTRCLERYLINEDTNWGEFFTKLEQRWDFFQDFLKNNPVETDIQDKFLYLENNEITEIEQWDEFSKAIEWEDSQKLAVNATGNLSKNECQQKFFECLLRGGIPLSLWHRCPQLNSLQVREQFQNILKVDVLQDLNKLLQKVLKVRRDAHDKHQKIALGYHLGFLCEHGDRIPSVLNPYQGGDSLFGSD